MSQNITLNNRPLDREYITGETIAYNGSSTYTLTVPTNAQIAEMQIQGGAIKYSYDVSSVTNGIILGNGQFLELESNDEMMKFIFTPSNGGSGKLVVFYFNTNIPNV